MKVYGLPIADVLLIGTNGRLRVMPPFTNTDAARGTAYVAANTASEITDILQLAAATFNTGTTPVYMSAANVAGVAGGTTIRGSVSSLSGEVITSGVLVIEFPSIGQIQRLSDLTITNTHDPNGSDQMTGLVCNPAGTLILENLSISGYIDGVIVADTTTGTVEFHGGSISSAGSDALSARGGTIKAYGVTFTGVTGAIIQDAGVVSGYYDNCNATSALTQVKGPASFNNCSLGDLTVDAGGGGIVDASDGSLVGTVTVTSGTLVVGGGCNATAATFTGTGTLDLDIDPSLYSRTAAAAFAAGGGTLIERRVLKTGGYDGWLSGAMKSNISEMDADAGVGGVQYFERSDVNLVTLNCQNTTAYHGPAYFRVIGCTNLANLTFTAGWTFAYCANLLASGVKLTVASVDAIWTKVDAGARATGTVNTSGQTPAAPPTPVGNAAVDGTGTTPDISAGTWAVKAAAVNVQIAWGATISAVDYVLVWDGTDRWKIYVDGVPALGWERVNANPDGAYTAYGGAVGSPVVSGANAGLTKGKACKIRAIARGVTGVSD